MITTLHKCYSSRAENDITPLNYIFETTEAPSNLSDFNYFTEFLITCFCLIIQWKSHITFCTVKTACSCFPDFYSTACTDMKLSGWKTHKALKHLSTISLTSLMKSQRTTDGIYLPCLLFDIYQWSAHCTSNLKKNSCSFVQNVYHFYHFLQLYKKIYNVYQSK